MDQEIKKKDTTKSEKMNKDDGNKMTGKRKANPRQRKY